MYTFSVDFVLQIERGFCFSLAEDFVSKSVSLFGHAEIGIEFAVANVTSWNPLIKRKSDRRNSVSFEFFQFSVHFSVWLSVFFTKFLNILLGRLLKYFKPAV